MSAKHEAPLPLMGADEAGQQVGKSRRWMERSAAAGLVPHHKVGQTTLFCRTCISEIAQNSLQPVEADATKRQSPRAAAKRYRRQRPRASRSA